MARLNHVKSFRGTTKTEDGCLRCGKCGTTIRKGDPYLWWANRLPGSRSGYRNIRCPLHPPSIAERTPGRAGEVMMAQQSAEGELASWFTDMEEFVKKGEYEFLDAPTDLMESFADEVADIAQEMTESADNMEEGFGHATSTSDELRERADDLEGQAEEARGVSFEDVPDRDDFCGTEGEFEEDEYVAALEEWVGACQNTADEAINQLDLS